MFDKERFHNSLALSLGYERIIKDKRITIQVDNSDDPWVMLKVQDYQEVFRIKASDTLDKLVLEGLPDMQDEINFIADVVHQAYIDASTSRFWI